MSEVQDCTFKPQLVSHTQSRIEYQDTTNESTADLKEVIENSLEETNENKAAYQRQRTSLSYQNDENQIKHIDKHINRLTIAKLKMQFDQ